MNGLLTRPIMNYEEEELKDACLFVSNTRQHLAVVDHGILISYDFQREFLVHGQW